MSEETLLRAAGRGDAEALGELIRGLAPDVYAYLAGMLADEAEAEDALQETFVRLARSLGRWDPGTDAAARVFGIARRVAADVRPTPSAHPGPVPEAASDLNAWARRALRALDAEHRELVVARDILHWDDATIAARTGLLPDDVPVRLRDARERLLANARKPMGAEQPA